MHDWSQRRPSSAHHPYPTMRCNSYTYTYDALTLGRQSNDRRGVMLVGNRCVVAFQWMIRSGCFSGSDLKIMRARSFFFHIIWHWYVWHDSVFGGFWNTPLKTERSFTVRSDTVQKYTHSTAHAHIIFITHRHTHILHKHHGALYYYHHLFYPIISDHASHPPYRPTLCYFTIICYYHNSTPSPPHQTK